MTSRPANLPTKAEGLDVGAFVRYADGVHSVASRVASTSQRLSVVQAHPDDAALSIGGLLSGYRGAIDLHTLFSRSPQGPQRMQEDRDFATLISARLVHHDLLESSGLGSSTYGVEIDVDAPLILAPAAISRHVDHLATREIMIARGVKALWEDVAFWGIYGQSVDDRLLAMQRDVDVFADAAILSVRITRYMDAKVAALKMYGSQSRDVWRVVRYAWTAGMEIGDEGEYHERIFVNGDVEPVLTMLGLSVVSETNLDYGRHRFPLLLTEHRQ